MPRRRPLLVFLALAANLIAAGLPVLHAMAHLGHHGEPHHAEAVAAFAHTDHEHGAVHPEALHDDAGPRSGGGVSFAFLASVDLPVLHVALHERRDTPIPVPRLSSRAPPPGDPARAPPLA